MKSKQLFLLVVAASLMFPLAETLADPPVTFEVVATFNYPPGGYTNAFGINDLGDVGGLFVNEVNRIRGFVRFADGHFSPPILNPNHAPSGTVVSDINNVGTLCGYYSSAGHIHGFLLSGSTFTDVSVGMLDTFAESVNDAGNFCGYADLPLEAFVSIDETVTSFTIPGSSGTTGFGINNSDQVVGAYYVGQNQFGFRRDADGTLAYPIEVPGAPQTALTGINDNGLMVASIFDGTAFRAAFFQSPGQSVIYDYPGASYTDFRGINNRGLISGTYSDGSGTHGFIVRVRPATGD
jgi:hypothetical protein